MGDNELQMNRLAKIRQSTRRAVVILPLGLLASKPAFAYIDPGTGSIILQGLLASIAVALGIVRAYWSRVKAIFSSARSREPDDHGIESVDGEDANLDRRI